MIPKDEQPYKIPDNWRWISLLDSFENKTSSNKKIQQKDYLSKGKIAVVDQGQKLIGGYTNEIDLKYDGNLPIILFGDHTRCIKYIDFPFVQGADGVKILEPQKYYLPKALFYIMQNLNIPNLGYRRHFPLFKNYIIPLPPLDEQQHIVDIIENLFIKLDKAKALAQNVIDNYELRRSAILHKAFTGQLTNPDLNDWKIFSWESCIKKMQNGISKRNGDTGDEIIVLRLYDIKNNEINLSNARTISLNDKEQENYLLKINDLLMIRVNGSKDNVGKQLLIKSSDKLAFCDHLIRIQYIDEIFPKYMLYFSQCKDYKDYVLANIVSSAGQNTISRKGMTNLNIPIPNIDEQKEIVRILDSLLAKEQQTKELAEQILQKIDLMKKAILARAFRGEFVK